MVGQIIVMEHILGDLTAQKFSECYDAEWYGFPYPESMFTRNLLLSAGVEWATQDIVLICDNDSLFPSDFFTKLADIHRTWQNLIAFTQCYDFLRPDNRNEDRNPRLSPDEWSTLDTIVPVPDAQWCDGNCSLRREYAQQVRFNTNLLEYGDGTDEYAHRIAHQLRVVPCLFEDPWYEHWRHGKDSSAYRITDANAPFLKNHGSVFSDPLIPRKVTRDTE
jgi:hypothetical protein